MRIKGVSLCERMAEADAEFLLKCCNVAMLHVALRKMEKKIKYNINIYINIYFKHNIQFSSSENA